MSAVPTYVAVAERDGVRVEIRVTVEQNAVHRDSDETGEAVGSYAGRIMHGIQQSRARAELPF